MARVERRIPWDSSPAASRLLPLLLILLSLPLMSIAYSEPPESPDRGENTGTDDDTLLVPADSAEVTDGIREQRSPTGALLRSAVLPGWGQFYNDEELKGVVLGSIEIGLAVWLLLEHLAAEDARQDYLESGDPADESRYLTHRQRRLDLIWYTSGAWLYGMFDAYVDAHLYAFEQENREFERKVGIGVGLSIRF